MFVTPQSPVLGLQHMANRGKGHSQHRERNARPVLPTSHYRRMLPDRFRTSVDLTPRLYLRLYLLGLVFAGNIWADIASTPLSIDFMSKRAVGCNNVV